MKPYSSKFYEILFDKKSDPKENALDAVLRHKDVFLYRVKTIKSGDILECEIYPIWKCQNDINRAKRKEKSRKAQEDLNDKNTKKAIVRKVNANFTGNDICNTMTYEGVPPTEEQARRDIRNYIRRVRDWRRRNGLTGAFKYIYAIEFDDGKGKTVRVHHHIIMSGMDRDAAEALWGKGRANCRRLQPKKDGLEAIARYIAKGKKGKKRWSASTNLTPPKVTTADHKITKRQMERIAVDKEMKVAPAVFERFYGGYTFNTASVRFSDFVAGAYLYVQMYRNCKGGGKAEVHGKQITHSG